MSAICYACTEKKKGCQWSGTFSELLKHEKLCDYVEIDCEYEGCEYKCIRKEMVKHEEKCVPILQFKLSERNEEYINLQNKYENLKIKCASLENELMEKDEIILQLSSLLKDFKEALIESNK